MTVPSGISRTYIQTLVLPHSNVASFTLLSVFVLLFLYLQQWLYRMINQSIIPEAAPGSLVLRSVFCTYNYHYSSIIERFEGLPWQPMVKTLSSNAQDVCLIPAQGMNTPHASQPKNQNIKNRSNNVTNSIQTLKSGPCYKKKSF